MTEPITDPVPEVSVVIPARNAAATLPAQLAALAAQDFRGIWEVVVADNASTDDTAAVVARGSASIPQLRRVLAEQPGVNVARNAGAREARGPLVLLCDADDEVSPGWVSAMVEALQTYDVVAGALEYEQLNEPDAWRPDDFAVSALPAVFGRPYALTGNLGFRRAVFDAVRGFDEAFTYGGEDIDFSWRARHAGFSLGFAPDAVVHYRLRSGTRAFMRQQYAHAKGEARVYAKHAGLGYLPRRSIPRQLRAFLGDVYELLISLRGVVDPAGRALLARRAAWLAGTIVGALRYGVFV